MVGLASQHRAMDGGKGRAGDFDLFLSLSLTLAPQGDGGVQPGLQASGSVVSLDIARSLLQKRPLQVGLDFEGVAALAQRAS